VSFLDRAPARKNYAKLGYDRNPFPTRGEVRADIYHSREELKEVEQKLASFVFDKGKGAFFALEGNRGVGKSNFLQHVELKLQGLEALRGIAVRYVGSQLVSPRQLGEAIVMALTEDRMKSWIAKSPKVPSYLVGTDLGRFAQNVGASKPTGADLAQAAKFLMRWLSGHQTYVQERTQYGLWAKERLDPSSAFPFLRAIVDDMVAAGLLRGVVLLIDEAEDFLTEPDASDAHAAALKALVNSFNFDHLFIVMAGQEGAIARVGTALTSLSSRWRVKKIEPLRTSKAAVQLAHAYLGEAATKGTRRPTDVDVEAAFGRLASKYSTGVSQRDLLAGLHEWVEEAAQK
jgi:hypothetical protein